MATYKFDDLNNGLEISNPTILIHGQVGTEVINGVPQNVAFADIIITTESTSFGHRLRDESKPASDSIEDWQAWVTVQLAKYEVNV